MFNKTPKGGKKGQRRQRRHDNANEPNDSGGNQDNVPAPSSTTPYDTQLRNPPATAPYVSPYPPIPNVQIGTGRQGSYTQTEYPQLGNQAPDQGAAESSEGEDEDEDDLEQQQAPRWTGYDMPGLQPQDRPRQIQPQAQRLTRPNRPARPPQNLQAQPPRGNQADSGLLNQLQAGSGGRRRRSPGSPGYEAWQDEVPPVGSKGRDLIKHRNQARIDRARLAYFEEKANAIRRANGIDDIKRITGKDYGAVTTQVPPKGTSGYNSVTTHNAHLRKAAYEAHVKAIGEGRLQPDGQPLLINTTGAPALILQTNLPPVTQGSQPPQATINSATQTQLSPAYRVPDPQYPSPRPQPTQPNPPPNFSPLPHYDWAERVIGELPPVAGERRPSRPSEAPPSPALAQPEVHTRTLDPQLDWSPLPDYDWAQRAFGALPPATTDRRPSRQNTAPPAVASIEQQQQVGATSTQPIVLTSSPSAASSSSRRGSPMDTTSPPQIGTPRRATEPSRSPAASTARPSFLRGLFSSRPPTPSQRALSSSSRNPPASQIPPASRRIDPDLVGTPTLRERQLRNTQGPSNSRVPPATRAADTKSGKKKPQKK